MGAEGVVQAEPHTALHGARALQVRSRALPLPVALASLPALRPPCTRKTTRAARPYGHVILPPPHFLPRAAQRPHASTVRVQQG